MLVGTRSQPDSRGATLLNALAVPANDVRNLDGPDWLDPADLVTYTARLLTSRRGAAAKAYRDREELAAVVAEAVAARARPLFLVAQLTGRALAAAAEPVDVDETGWAQRFPAEVGAAMDGYLDRLGADRQRAVDLLTPLAYAEGDGLPYGELWPACAAVLAGVDPGHYRLADLRWLLDSPAADLLQAGPTATPGYRLYHHALADHLHHGDPTEAHRRPAPAVEVRKVTDTPLWAIIQCLLMGCWTGCMSRGVGVSIEKAWPGPEAVSGRSEDALRLSEERFRLLVGNIVDYAIIILDPQGVVQSWNLGAYRLKGYEDTEIIGQHFSVFYSPEDRMHGVPLAMLDEARAQGHAQRAGWRLRKDGARFWGEVIITAIHDTGGDLAGFVKITRDLTERHAAEEALRQSEERFRLLIDSVVDYAIIGLDPQGVVQTWNRGAHRLKGYKAEEIIGRHFSLFYGPEDRARALPMHILDEARMNEHAQHAGWRVRNDGSRFWGDVTVTATRGNEGNLLGFVKITRDLTERHAAEEEVRRSIEREERAAAALELEEMRTNFINSISHDLRTPAASIQGFAQLLLDERLTDETQRETIFRQISDCAQTLQGMVEDLLETGRLGSGAVKLSHSPVAVAATVGKLVDHIRPVLQGRSVTLELPDDLTVSVDPGAFERIMSNLLTNAAKFSDADSNISVRGHVEQDQAVLSVEDQGIGIGPEEQEFIFERFRQGRNANERRPGAGLGLSIVRDYVSLHGGRVWVESEPEEGSCFWMTLPLADGRGGN